MVELSKRLYVVDFDEFVDGFVVECENHNLACMKYYKNEFGEEQQEKQEVKLDFDEIITSKTFKDRVSKLRKQLNYRGVLYLDAQVYLYMNSFEKMDTNVPDVELEEIEKYLLEKEQEEIVY